MNSQLNKIINNNNNNMLSVKEYHLLAQKMSASPNKSIVSTTLKMCTTSPQTAIVHILDLTPEELAAIAKDASGSKYLQEHLETNKELRLKIYSTVLAYGLLIPLAKDHFANFVIQKLISCEKQSKLNDKLFDAIEKHSLELSFHRFACRVVQEFVRAASVFRTRRLLTTFAHNEGRITRDQNANHIVQRVLDRHTPDVYAPFVKALVIEPGVKVIIEDKYGCRVIQMCLEKIVAFCSNVSIPDSEKKSAYELLHVLIKPILTDALMFSENEYANYIVQYIICTDFLSIQRNYIIKNCVLHHILWLSQSKFASNVVEKSLVHADVNLLKAMFTEILEGYESDDRGRDALDIMLFDQFANYVVQRLLTIAIEVYHRKRVGEASWFEKLASRIRLRSKELQRYSSGKKILDMLAVTLYQHHYRQHISFRY